MDKTVHINYFAIFKEQRGLSEEHCQTGASTVGQLYDELKGKYRFTLARNVLRAALNDEFCEWDQSLKTGDKVVFIAPVAGG